MTARLRTTRWNFGTVTVRPSFPSAGDSGTVYEWRPDSTIAGFVPANYSVALECRGAVGRRQFLLADEFPMEFLLNASLGGQVILAVRNGHRDEEQLIEQDFYRLLYQRTRHTGGFFDRSFLRYSDLHVSSLGRSSSRERDVLPDTIGLDERGNGRRWTTEDLSREGREACREAGRVNPRQAEIIRRGLLRAAQRNPLVGCGVEQARTLIRMAVFAVTAEIDEVTTAQVDWVERQVAASFREHLGDGTEQFTRFLEDPKSNLVHRIAKRKSTPVGTLTRGQVRAALATIGWRATQSLGDCVDAQMRTFRATLPEPLTEWEESKYGTAFLRQRCFGNLPLILFKDRVGFLHDALLDIFEEPREQRRIAVLHRMLSYYEEMLAKRRLADTQSQQRRLAINDEGRAASRMSLSDLAAEPEHNTSQQGMTEFKEIVKYVLVAQHLAREEEFEGDWDAELGNASEPLMELLVSRSNHPVPTRYSISREEFAQLARRWRGLDESSIS